MRAFLVAGEASGDRLGAALMAGLKTLRRDITFDGVGGSRMQAEGLKSRFDMDELSVMGISEVLPRYRNLRRRMIETAEAVISTRPDVLITIDSPDFCLRLARTVRQRQAIRAVHYVAPSVWAWRPKRADRMARHVDQVLAILPFEPPYMEAAGMRCDFVGHPVVSEPVATAVEIDAFRRDAGFGSAPLLLVLPGSRRSEVTRLAPVFGEVVERLRVMRPGLRVALPAAPGLADLLGGLTEDWADTLVVEDADLTAKRAAFAAADVALAASGTVSLELAAAGTPMVVAYDMSWLSWQIMRRMALIDTVTLVNLVTGTRVVPEFLGPDCRAAPIAAALERLFADPGGQDEALVQTMAALGRGDEAPGLRAARAVLDGIAYPR